MTTVFHSWLYGRFMEKQSNLRRKKLHRTNQVSNFLGGSFSSRDNVKATIQFRRENQSQHLKRCFLFKTRPIHIPINSISTIRPIKTKQAEFFQHLNQQATSCPSLHCLVDQIQFQLPTLVVATYQMPDHALRIEQCHKRRWQYYR